MIDAQEGYEVLGEDFPQPFVRNRFPREAFDRDMVVQTNRWNSNQ
jgi:hypothetical protein